MSLVLVMLLDLVADQMPQLMQRLPSSASHI
jgi:hypothetical protein